MPAKQENGVEKNMRDFDSQTDATLTMFEGQWADHGDDGGGGFHFVFGQHEKSPSSIHPSDVLNYAEDFYPEDKGFVQAKQRARRVRVCVNACVGVPSSVLETAESGGPNAAEWFRDWSALPAEAHELGVKEWIEAQKAQRAALVALLQEVIDTPPEGWSLGDAMDLIARCRKALRAGGGE